MSFPVPSDQSGSQGRRARFFDLAKTVLLRSEERLAEAGEESELVMMIHDEMVSEVEEAPPHCRLRGEALETKVRIAVGITWGDLSLNTFLSQ